MQWGKNEIIQKNTYDGSGFGDQRDGWSAGVVFGPRGYVSSWVFRVLANVRW